MHEIERQNEGGGAIETVRFINTEIFGENVQQVGAAFGDVVGQQLDAIDAHQAKQGVMALLKIRLAVFKLNCGKLALEDIYQKVAAATGGFQKAGVNSFALVFNEIKHGLNHPCGGEYLPMVSDSLFGFNKTHVSLRSMMRPASRLPRQQYRRKVANWTTYTRQGYSAAMIPILLSFPAFVTATAPLKLRGKGVPKDIGFICEKGVMIVEGQAMNTPLTGTGGSTARFSVDVARLKAIVKTFPKVAQIEVSFEEETKQMHLKCDEIHRTLPTL